MTPAEVAAANRAKIVARYREAAAKSASLRMQLYGFGIVFETTAKQLSEFEAQATAIARAIEVGAGE